MKATGGFVAVLVLAGCASATVDFFFSHSADPYGLRVPSLAFLATNGNGYDFRDGYELMPHGGPYAVPPYAEPGSMPDVELECGSSDWAYIWARFNNEPGYLQVGRISGIVININGAGSGQGNIAYYICNNLADSNIRTQRWDGDPGMFYNNPTSLIAITATSIGNKGVDEPWNLYVGGTHRAFLLGAVKCLSCPGELTIDVSAICYAGTPSNPAPPCPVPRYLNKVICIPEPAGLLLLTTLALVLRRR